MNNDIRRTELKPTGISSDGGEILFNVCLVGKNCTFARFDTKAKTWITYVPPKDQIWGAASYSNDGKNIVFSIASQKDNFNLNQLAIMDIQNNRYKILPTKKGYIINPEYSKYEPFIYYVKDATNNPSTRIWDIYRFDLSRNVEEAWLILTAYSLSTPSFSPSGEAVFAAADIRENKGPDIGENKGPDPKLYLKTGDKLREISFPGYSETSRPKFRGDGKLYFSGTNLEAVKKAHKRFFEVYVADRNLSHLKQVTAVNNIIQTYVISDNEKTVAATLQDPEHPFPVFSVLINSAGETSKMNFNPASAQKITPTCSNCK